MNRLLLSAVLLIAACDPSPWSDQAPPAPDYDPEEEERDDSNDKHPGTHSQSYFMIYDAPGTNGQFSWCGGSDGSTCWWKSVEYGTRYLYYNSTGTNNVPPKTWWMERINWSVCAPGIIGVATPGSIQVCRDGFCLDVTGQWSTNTGNCRTGSIGATAFGNWSIPPNSLRHVDIYVRLNEGQWMFNPQLRVSMTLGPYVYWD